MHHIAQGKGEGVDESASINAHVGNQDNAKACDVGKNLRGNIADAHYHKRADSTFSHSIVPLFCFTAGASTADCEAEV
jgi:hypothetical protein